ncbi:hypothetical protein A2229_03800 [Candidatus Peregrinibacteria bacterium RIFOXYA2_FULL_33_7]|nr:MAG: hypothetical protein A2229_03800 [Candidatus Peregrinibacteria bacterium RIFOXYA2_FULL_33_7]
MEVFLDNLIKTNDNPNLQILDTGKNLTNYALEDDEHGTNPHISLSPKLAIKQTENIKNKLQQLDPRNSEFYENNFKAYQKKLEELSKNITDQFKNTEKKDFLVFHEAYNYYLEEFNLLIYQKGSIEEFPGKEPSPAYLQNLIQEIKNQNIKIIFVEPQFSPKIIQTLKDELNIRSFELAPIGQELTNKGYENNLQQVTNTIIQAFTLLRF